MLISVQVLSVLVLLVCSTSQERRKGMRIIKRPIRVQVPENYDPLPSDDKYIPLTTTYDVKESEHILNEGTKPRKEYETYPKSSYEERPTENYEGDLNYAHEEGSTENYERELNYAHEKGSTENYESDLNYAYEEKSTENYERNSKYSYEGRPRENYEINPKHSYNKRPTENYEINSEPSYEQRPTENYEINSEHSYEKRPTENYEINSQHSYEQRPTENYEINSEHSYEKRPTENYEINSQHSYEQRPTENYERNPKHSYVKRPTENYEKSPKYSYEDYINSDNQMPFAKRTEEKSPVVPIIENENYVYAYNGDYHYSYKGADGTQAFQRGELNAADDAPDAVVGGFSYKDKDGNDYSVTYTAGENGYRPVGAHLPTPPPIPPAIQRVLRILATKTTPEPVTESLNNDYY